MPPNAAERDSWAASLGDAPPMRRAEATAAGSLPVAYDWAPSVRYAGRDVIAGSDAMDARW